MKSHSPALRRLLALGTTLLALPLYGQTAPANDQVDNEDDIYELTPFEVSSDDSVGYMATTTLAGTRIRTDLADVGAAISVVTKEFMGDVGATDNKTLLQYTTNAEVSGSQSTYAGLGNGQSLDELSQLRSPGGAANRVRGLSAADNTRDFFVSDIPWDGYNVERVDIQRGPNAILFGLGKPAGMVNASLDNAQFFDTGEVALKIDNWGSFRANLDFNREIIDNELAVRFEMVRDNEKFRQDEAFEDDARYYGTMRWDPKFLSSKNFRTSIKVKVENGEIDANRPRVIPPNDHITAWYRPTTVSADNPFGGMNKLLVTNGYAAEREDTPPIAGDNSGLTRPADPDYNPYVSGRGNQQQPFYFMDGTSGELYRIYGGYINPGAYNSNGTLRGPGDGLAGKRYSGVFYGVGGLPYYANQVRLPGYQYGQYREQSLTDDSIFDFYNTLIDGPTKREFENWDTYSIDLSESAYDNRLALQLTYDRQVYERGGESFLGWAPTLDIDILQNFQDLQANPNVGRPYVQGNGSGSSYNSEREVTRASLFAEFRPSDVMDNSLLEKIIGIHRFNGVYSHEEFLTETRSWRLYATSQAWDNYWNGSTSANVTLDDRPPVAMIYLGGSIAGRNSASGANIPGITQNLQLTDGPIYAFDSTWTAGSGVAFDAPWTVPANYQAIYNFTGTATPMQNSNPANYKGWNSDYNLDILDNASDDLTVNASKGLRKLNSYAGTWQGFWWDGAFVSTVGWRYDSLEQYSKAAPRIASNRSRPDLSPSVYRFDADPAEFSDHSLSWGGVLHLNKILEKDPLPINISLSYNTSSNFEVTGVRKNMFGSELAPPSGETKDYGVVLATKDNKYILRMVKYEATAENASTEMSSLNGLGDIISFGLRWANVFEYDLSGYTPDTAGNAGSEWRYNFDPDTSIGETQEQATARENAAIAAWRQIGNSMPASFYQYWGWDPTRLYAYPLYSTPQGLTLTSDTQSEGYEFEFTANPTRNWRISLNVSSTEAVRNNVGGAETAAFVNYITQQMAGPAGELRVYSGGPTAHTLRAQWNSWLGNWTLLKLQEGSAASEIRKWRYNVVTNYTFDDGALKGVGIGGGYRWQDKVVIGYPVLAIDASTFTFDLDKPYYGPEEDAVDLWVSYERELTKNLRWKIQVNVRNAFAEDELIPISVQPDGKTWAAARIAPPREFFVTNTFMF